MFRQIRHFIMCTSLFHDFAQESLQDRSSLLSSMLSLHWSPSLNQSWSYFRWSLSQSTAHRYILRYSLCNFVIIISKSWIVCTVASESSHFFTYYNRKFNLKCIIVNVSIKLHTLSNPWRQSKHILRNVENVLQCLSGIYFLNCLSRGLSYLYCKSLIWKASMSTPAAVLSTVFQIPLQ